MTNVTTMRFAYMYIRYKLIRTSGTSLFNKDNLAYEGCPKRKCHNWKLLREEGKVKLDVVPRTE